MAEQTAVPESGPSGLPGTTTDEDAGRLTTSSTGRLVAILVALVLFSEVVPFQFTMISVIVPKIGESFPQAGANANWTVTILGVAGGATMALTGKLGDLWGKKKVLAGVSLLFLVGTLICAITTSWPLFLVGRAIGAVSWGMSAIEYGIVRDLMPRRWIPVCIGVLGTGFGISTVAGPLIVGTLTDHYSWRSVFWFLAIYMIVTIPLFLFIVPESPLRVRQRLDIVGAVLFGAGVGAVLIYVSEGSSWGWTNASCLAYLIGGLVGIAAFILWEARVPDPMIELRLLRAPKVAIPMIIALIFTGVAAVINIAVAYMFETPKAADVKQQILDHAAAQSHVPTSVVSQFIHFNGDLSYGAGFSVMQMTLHIILWTALLAMILGPIGGLIARRIGARLPLIVGLTALLVACALFISWHTTWQEQLGIGLLAGVCFGLYYATNPNLLIDAVPAERQGISAGMFAVFGGIGSSLATALVTAIQTAHPFQVVATMPGSPPVVQTVPGLYDNSAYSQIYLLLGVIPVAVALVLALVLRTGRTPARGGEAVAF